MVEDEARNHASGRSRSELRLAVTFTGGVSLAVWMGGVAREMNLLAAASRTDAAEPPAAADRLVAAKYRGLLDLLELHVSLDVLSGTSAGGINAAFLGMATVRRRDLGGLRDLWLVEGSLDRLLRDPAEPAPPSLLLGDGCLLRGLTSGLNRLADPAARDPAHDDDPTRVFITTTLLDGLESPFKDDYGTAIRDTAHQGLFTFDARQLNTDGVVDTLALAARSSASFPGAFEPAFVPIGAPDADGGPDMARHMTPGARTQFCADGGLLANRPLGPALDAVFERGASREVRRVLAYVVPTPGVPETRKPPGRAEIPALGPALLADLDAVRSQSITAELRALLAHNDRVRGRENAESRLAGLAGPDGTLGAGTLFDDYRTLHAGALARAAAAETLRQLTTHDRRTADGRPVGFGDDLDRLTAAAAEAIGGELPLHLEAPLFDRFARFGRPALDGAKATVLRLVRGGFASPSLALDDRAALGELIGRVHAATRPSPGPDLREEVGRALAAVLPAGGPLPPDAVSRVIGSDGWCAAVCGQLPADGARSALGGAWEEVAAVVVGARDLLRRLTAGRDAVLAHLTDGAPATDPHGWVARRLFELQAAQRVMYPDEPAARQRVELVQMSADTRTLLDPRSLAREKLTGLQFHHFGAFYKGSWRANDWMWGRLDGAGWLVHLLLSPELLRRLADERGLPPGALMSGLEQIAGTTAPPQVPDELARVMRGSAQDLPESLSATSLWVASGLQRLVAAEELGCVARQAGLDRERGTAAAVDGFLAAYRDAASRAGPDDPAGVPVSEVESLLGACGVSRETFEQERGTKPLARAVVRAAAVTSNAVAAGAVRWRVLRPLFGVIGTSLRLADRVLRRGRQR